MTEQDEKQAKHALEHGETLPREVERDGKHLTLLYRSRPKGGRGVFLQASDPGSATGHKLIVFELDVVNGCEVLGKEVAVVPSLDVGILVAN
jgi:hypothetical protein